MPDTHFDKNLAEGDLRSLIAPVLMGLGAISLLRTSRVLSLALLGTWLYHVASSSDADRVARGRALAARRAASDVIDAEMADSFPASDPPSFSGSTAGAP